MRIRSWLPWAILGLLVLEGLHRVDAETVQYTGHLLVTIEGTSTNVDRATDILREPGALSAEQAGVLFDIPTTAGDECPDPNALSEGTAQVRRVLVLKDGSAAAFGETTSASNAWDAAYRAAATEQSALSAEGAEVTMVEPDLAWVNEELDAALAAASKTPGALTKPDQHVVTGQHDKHWPRRMPLDWHLRAAELDTGESLVEQRLPGQTKRVVIAHFDTGFTPCNDTGLARNLRRDKSWDFTVSGCSSDNCGPKPGGVDLPSTGLLKSRGHGTGTLSILAGGTVNLDDGGQVRALTLGGAPFADVVEYRLADFVAIWRPSVVASALHWAAKHDVDVVSMSMGGPPTYTLHHAVNEAYCSGVAMFTAAGNNFGFGNALLPVSTPWTTVFPARYDRVVSVVGVTGDELTYAKAPCRSDYYLFPWRTVMRGNVGPRWVMGEAIAAWTPNVPWLVFRDTAECGNQPAVRLNGSGTSAATPQVAAAAAQWLQYNIDDARIAGHWRSWQKVESVYQALLDNAGPGPLGEAYRNEWYGRGIVRSATAIRAEVPTVQAPRRRARLDTEWLADAILSLVGGPADLGVENAAARNMLSTEIAQLAVSSEEISSLIDAAGMQGEGASGALRRRLLQRLSSDERASTPLRKLAKSALQAKEGE